MKRSVLGLVLLCVVSLGDAGSFQIQDIRVEGLQRISAGTIFNYLPVEVGDSLAPKDDA